MAKKPVEAKVEAPVEVKKELTQRERHHAIKMKALEPMLVIITPNKAELSAAPSDSIIVSNKIVGDIFEVFPFGEPVALPRCAVEAIRAARYVRIDEVKSAKGKGINADGVDSGTLRQLVPTYSVAEQEFSKEDKEKLMKGL